MTNISLRAYHRKIELLLEDQLAGQALIHCRALLEEFPKNHQTYRLASRALLDCENLDAAEEGLNILLQIDPDDFIAHIGKSVISESKGLLDEAVTHMKHAFELQTANEGLQAEVRRLLEKKDTVSPSKLILTRGALIKMYMRGKLFDQAIGEILIGLKESPNRLDFQLALAESLMDSGKSIQAVEICTEIIKRLPYCLRANIILLKASRDKPSDDGNHFYLAHLAELDPYYAYLLPTTLSVLDVPDIAVMTQEKIPPEAPEIPSDWKEFLLAQWQQVPASDNQIEADLDEAIQKIMDPSFSQPFFGMQIPDDQNGKMERDELDDIFLKQDGMTEEMGSKRSAFMNRLRGISEETLIEPEYPTIAREAADDEAPSPEADEIVGEKPVIEIPPDELIPFNAEADDNEEPSANLEVEIPESIWVSGEGVEHDVSGISTEALLEEKPEKLNDTQPIKIMPMEPELVIQEAEKAVNGGNFQYALKLIKPLIDQDIELDAVCRYLEGAVEMHPEKISYLLLLGEVYTRMSNLEKALEVFRKAQSLISL
jgi:tetratricopeptide (TPR) repeat protein